ncbi:MAG: restriction endonuclease, partial [Armatimonadetes bacterium]|nr:restriction endonuclease [Armatimonadota bacterium]
YEVIGEPQDVQSARALAEQNRYQFEWWALGLVEARPAQDKKKGADKGVDGLIVFFDDDSGKAKKIIVQVKSGHVGAPQVQQLKGAMEQENAEMAAFITLEEPTGPMKKEAATAGFYDPPGLLPAVARVQILTIAELLAGRKLEYPRIDVATFKKAPRKRKAKKADGSG